jgi:hypothetical protein
MMAYIEAAQKKWDSETRESFTSEELDRLWGAIAVLGDNVNSSRGN